MAMERERTISPENPALGVPQDHRFPVRVAAFAASAVGPEAVALGPIFIRRGGRRALWELSTRRGASSRAFVLYAPECVEEESYELRVDGVLRSSLPASYTSNRNNPHYERCACPFCCATIVLLRRCYRGATELEEDR